MSTTSPGPYDWASDTGSGLPGGPMPAAPDTRTMPQPRTAPAPLPPEQRPENPPPENRRRVRRPEAGPSRGTRAAEAVGTAVGSAVGAAAGSFVPPVHLTYAPTNNGGAGGGGGRGGGGAGAAAPGAGDRHQGDRMIYMVERIELRSDKDIVALCRAINRLGRELHLILGMRAEEVQGVLSTYKGKWYHFGASNRVRARLVAAHLRVGAEAAKALGVAALKTAHAFDRHFVAPEREAKQRARGQKPAKKTFTIGEE